jgi:hypothetical protein
MSIERENSALGAKVNVTLNDKEIEPTNIKSIIVREWTFDHSRIPRLELIMLDDGMFIDVNIPSQGKIISIDISKDKDDVTDDTELISLKGDYIILDFNIAKNNAQQAGAPNIITISAVLNVPEFFALRPTEAFSDKDSKQVLKTISRDLGCSFNSNIDATSDTMNWLNIYQSNASFIQHVVSRSFLGSEDCTLCYIDINSQMNYMSIITAMGNTPKVTKFNSKMALSESLTSTIAEGKLQGFTETESAETLWFSNIVIKNSSNSSGIINNGFSNSVTFVDLKTGSYTLGTASKVDSPTQQVTETIVDNHSVLLTTDEDPNKISLVRDTKEYVGVLSGHRESGDNIYSDEYYSSKITRKNILAGLIGMPFLIEVNPNVAVANFELLNLEMPTSFKLEQHDSNEILDGNYIVLGILHVFDDGFYKKILSIHRVGFNAYQGDL